MFSPLRTEKFYGKKIKIKDIDSRNLTFSTPNRPTPKKTQQKQQTQTKSTHVSQL